MATKSRGRAANVLSFPSEGGRDGSLSNTEREQLELAFVLQRETIQNLEDVLLYLHQANRADAHPLAHRLIVATIADLKAMATETTWNAEEIAALYSRLEECRYVLSLSHRLICSPRRPGVDLTP